MQRVVLVFLIAVTAAAAPNVKQGRWQEIGKTAAGNPVFVDPKTVKKAADGIVTATLRVTFVKPVASPNGPPIKSSRTVAMFDCAKKVVAVKENTFYHDEAKNQVFQRSAPKLPGYGPAIKGTLPDVAMAYLCK